MSTGGAKRIRGGKGRISFSIEHSNKLRRQGVAFARELVCDARMDQFIAKHAEKLQGNHSRFHVSPVIG